MNLLQLRPEGLFCTLGDFYIDPWRPVNNAIITHAHSDHARPGHKNYVAAKESQAILRHRLGNISLQGWRYGDVRKLGEVWVSLHPAGHILGSSQIRIEAKGEVVVVTGDFKTIPDPTCEPFEPLESDVLITEATFSLPVYRWPQPRIVVREIYDWWRDCRTRGVTAILFCYALGKAQRVLAELSKMTNERVLLHGAVDKVTQIYRHQSVAMVPTVPVAEVKNYTGELVIAPPSAQGSSWMKRFKKMETGFCSGWMHIRGNRRRRGTERGFVLSDHADWTELLTTIDASRAKEVLLTHGRTETIVRYLQERGVNARALETAFGEDEE